VNPVLALTPAQRARAAADWAQIAQLEHASVASFARFTLHLLALGAPPQLVTGALQAGLDEVAHARAAFGLATRLGGAAVGPGPLPLGGDLFGPAGPADLAAVAAQTFAEGCVNETIGALEAAEAAAVCDDPDIRAVLERIAEEEARHGELAWAFARWALGQGGEPVRTAMAAAMARAEEALAPPPPPEDADAAVLRTVGLLDERTRGLLRRRGFDDIVRPSARTLGL
jgi:hypothetical protein